MHLSRVDDLGDTCKCDTDTHLRLLKLCVFLVGRGRGCRKTIKRTKTKSRTATSIIILEALFLGGFDYEHHRFIASHRLYSLAGLTGVGGTEVRNSGFAPSFPERAPPERVHVRTVGIQGKSVPLKCQTEACTFMSPFARIYSLCLTDISCFGKADPAEQKSIIIIVLQVQFHLSKCGRFSRRHSSLIKMARCCRCRRAILQQLCKNKSRQKIALNPETPGCPRVPVPIRDASTQMQINFPSARRRVPRCVRSSR